MKHPALSRVFLLDEGYKQVDDHRDDLKDLREVLLEPFPEPAFGRWRRWFRANFHSGVCNRHVVESVNKLASVFSGNVVFTVQSGYDSVPDDVLEHGVTRKSVHRTSGKSCKKFLTFLLFFDHCASLSDVG